MKLKELKEQLEGLDTFGLDPDKVEVVFKTVSGNELTFKDMKLSIEVNPTVKSTLVLTLRPPTLGGDYR